MILAYLWANHGGTISRVAQINRLVGRQHFPPERYYVSSGVSLENKSRCSQSVMQFVEDAGDDWWTLSLTTKIWASLCVVEVCRFEASFS